MNIIFITQLDPLYTGAFFKEFFANLSRLETGDLKVSVILLDGFNEGFVLRLRRIYKLFGPKDFAIFCCKYISSLFVNRSAIKLSRAMKSCSADITSLKNINAQSSLEYIKAKSPDYIVSISAPQIFKRPLLECCNAQYLNIHCSPLPAHKGMMPNFWQMLEDQQFTQITLHEISETIDAGEVLDYARFPILDGLSLHELIVLTKRWSAHLLINYLNKKKYYQRILGKESYNTFPSSRDSQQFRKLGRSFF